MKSFRSISRPLLWSMAVMLSALAAGCGSNGGGGGAPADTVAGATCVGADCVVLGAAGTYVILAQAGVDTVPTSAVTGNIGLSPAAATFLTGFSQTADASNVFSTSDQVTGKLYAANYAEPTPTNLTAAVGAMGTAGTDAAGRATSLFGGPDLTAGTLSTADCAGFMPGVYTWTTGLAIGQDCVLTGIATDVWIFQIAGNLTQTAGTTMSLAGGQKAENIFWQVTGSVDIGAGAHLEGIVLANTDVTLETGATMNGRLYSGTAVNLQSSTVVAPGL